MRGRSNTYWAALALALCALVVAPARARQALVVVRPESNAPPPPGPRLVVQRGHDGAVTAVALSPDGRRAVTCGADGAAILWDVATSRELRRYIVSNKPIRAVAFAPNGRQFATGGDDAVIRVWNVDVVQAPSPGRVTLGSEAPLPLLDGTLPRDTRSAANRQSVGHTDTVTALAYSPAGTRLLSGSRDGSMLLWDIRTGERLHRYGNHSGPVTCVAFSTSGNLVASGGEDRQVCIWTSLPDRPSNVVGLKETPDWETPPFDGPVSAVAISTNSDTRQYELFAATGTKVRTLSADSSRLSNRRFKVESQMDVVEPVRAVLAPGGAKPAGMAGEAGWFIAVTSHHAVVGRLGGNAPETALAFEDTVPEAGAAGFCGATGTLITGMSNGAAVCRAIGSDAGSRKVTRLEGRSQDLRTAAITPDGSRLFLLPDTPTKTVPAWDLRSGQPDVTTFTHAANVTSIYCPAGVPKLICGLQNGQTVVWNLERNAPSWTIPAASPASPVTAVVMDIKGGRIFRGTADGALEAWDVHRRRRLVRIVSGVGVSALALTRVGNVAELAVLRGTEVLLHTVTVASPPKGKGQKAAPKGALPIVVTKATLPFNDSKPGSSAANAIAFDPSGKLLAAGGADGLVRLYNLGQKRAVTFSIGNRLATDPDLTAIRSIAFTRDGKTIVTGSDNGEVSEWSTSNARRLSHPQDHQGPVTSVAMGVIATQEYRCTASEDGTARLQPVGQPSPTAAITWFGDGKWVVQDSGQRFDAEQGGEDLVGLHYVWNNDPITLPQMAREFYEPGLLGDALFRPNVVRRVADLGSVLPYPDVEITPSTLAPEVNLTLRERGSGGIGAVSVLLNGKLVKDFPREDMLADASGLVRRKVDLRDAAGWSASGQNILRVEASNRQGSLTRFEEKAIPTPANLPVAAASAGNEPRVFILGVGISNYAKNTGRNGALRILPYSDGDARDVCRALAMAAHGMLGTDEKDTTRVVTTLLTTAPNSSSPTKGNIEAAFETIRKQARPDDYVIVYLSGHGKSDADPTMQDPEYYFYTADVDPSRLTDPLLARDENIRAAISSAELAKYLGSISASHCTVFIDSCASGAVGQYLNKAWYKASGQGNFLTACSANQQTFETPGWNHSMMALSLLMVLAGEGGTKASIGIDQLLTNTAVVMADLGRALPGQSTPVPARRFPGKSYEFGYIEPEQRNEIARRLPPIIAAPRIATTSDDQDQDSLASNIGRRLGQLSTAKRGAGQSPNGRFVYLDTRLALDHAIKPSVALAPKGSRISVTISFERDGRAFGKRQHHEWPAGEVPARVAATIAATVVGSAKRSAVAPPSRPAARHTRDVARAGARMTAAGSRRPH